MSDTPNRSSTTTPNTAPSQHPPRPAGARPTTTTTTVRPAGGPNGNAGRRPTGAPPRPGAPGGPRPGGPGGQRPGNNGRPGGNGRPPQRGGPHGARNGAHAATSGAPRTAAPVKPSGPVEIPAQLAVKDLAELLNVSVNEVIRQLIAQGVFAAINDIIKYDAAAKVAETIGYTPSEAAAPVSAAAKRLEALRAAPRPVDEAGRVPRPPVVTVMGHVDHGKTSLLDAIRNTRVAAGEAGGITQHIGAYQAEINDRKITFLDTPGHEAFTAMRARGAQVTDIAVIVVAADDGVMPQTAEAIDHVRAAQAPMVIALNKIDKPNANPDHVKQQLVDYGVVIEEYGGDVVSVPVSAKKGTGIDELLEMILLVADLQDLRANPNARASGAVVEARRDPASGVTATMLMQEGTLKIGDLVVVGTISGKVRAMFDDAGKRIKKAPPATPVSILGLPEVPIAGERFEVVADEKAARALIEANRQAAASTAQSVSLDTLYAQMREGTVKELNLLVKCDVQGSAEALKHALARVGEEHASENLKVRLIHDAVGNVGETDVHLAAASKAIIIAFNVKVDGAAQRLASEQGVDIRTYSVIYKLVDDIEAALKGMLEPVYREQVDGHGEVIQTFKSGKTIIAGCRITDGKLTRGSTARVRRGNAVAYTGKIQSLRRGKDDVREVLQGFECGVVLEDYNDVEVGDIIEAYSQVRV
jgi:translation initiation factor IF-2